MAILGRWRCTVLFAPVLVAGCQMAPAGQTMTLTTQNRALTEQNHAQTVEIANLKEHNRQIEDKLIQSEEQLALEDQKLGTDQKRLANYQNERNRLRDQFASYSHVKIPPEVSAQLADLSRKHPSLQFDPQTGVAKLDSDVVFDSGSADLKPQADVLLSDLADVLQSPEAKDMRLMVVGH